ncbi:MAG: hypothetical protein WCA48_31855 [Pseudomonas gingeri]
MLERAVRASREATAHSAKLVGGRGGNVEHRAAREAHSRAATEHRGLAGKHAQAGRHRAAQHSRALEAEHEEMASHHAGRIQPHDSDAPGRARPKSATRAAGGRRAAETRGEREDFARQNIPADLLPLWEQIKGRFKGSPHERSEAFLEYADAHPQEVIEAMQERSDEQLDRMIREYEERTNPMAVKKKNADEETAIVIVTPYDYDREITRLEKIAECARYVWKELAADDDAKVTAADVHAAREVYLRARQRADGLTLHAQRMRAERGPQPVEGNPPAMFPAGPHGEGGVIVKANPPPSYRASHWGKNPGKVTDLNIPAPRDNRKMIGLGELVQVVYLTTKGGDSGPTEYVHKFERRLPVLAYGDHDGKLYVAGGSYKVSSRGIVG